MDPSYIKESPPKVSPNSLVVEGDDTDLEGDSGKRQKISVYVDMNILSILEISEVGGFVSIQVGLELTW